MPNWCENMLCVIGEKNELEKFIVDNKGNNDIPLSFDKALPSPDPEEENSDWWNWRIENWGTKWDLENNTNLYETEKEARYNFDTAWSPPTYWFEFVIKKYPKLEFELIFTGEGNEYAGKYTGINGKLKEYELKYIEV